MLDTLLPMVLQRHILRLMFRFSIGLASLLTLALASAAGSETLDNYTDLLPPNPNLPVTQARVVWHGTYCDDVACPPGMTVTQAEDLTTQLALPGAHGSGRLVGVGGSEVGTTVVMIDATQQKLLIKAVDVYEAVVSLDYPESPQAPGLSIDFTGGGADALAFEVSGEGLDGSATVTCWLQVSSVNFGEQHGQNIQAPGLVIFPFDTFSPQINFSQIDRVLLAIGVTASADLTIGPVHSIVSSTPVAATSWGALKARYR